MRNEGLGWMHPYAARMHTVGEARLARYAFDLDFLKWKPDDLLRQVVQRGTARMLLSLLDSGLAPDTSTSGESTPLLYAAAWGKPAMVSLLLRFGADPNFATWDGETPLMNTRQALITRRLLYHGANPRAQSEFGTTPLHRMAADGTYGAVELLLNWGADVDAVNTQGETPLMNAISWYQWDAPVRIRIMELLLARGADLQKQDRERRTPLLCAAWEGNAMVARFLLARGANPHDQDNKGCDAVQISQAGEAFWHKTAGRLWASSTDSHHQETTEILREAMRRG